MKPRTYTTGARLALSRPTASSPGPFMDMRAAGRSMADVRRSAREVDEGRFMSAEAFLAELGA